VPSIDFVCTFAATKANVVEQMREEPDGLLYGHHVGHAIEMALEPALSHGEAVSVGLAVEGALAVIHGRLAEDVWEEQHRALMALGLPVSIPPEVTYDLLISAMQRFRLFRDDTFLFDVPLRWEEPHQPLYLKIRREDLQSELRAAVAWVAERS
jgi:3-dehydroquinate synthetase